MRNRFLLPLLAAALLQSNVVFAAPVQASSSGGPSIAGVCVLSRQAVFDSSKVGKMANARYRQMHDAAQADVNKQETKIVSDLKALQAQQKSLKPADYQQRQQVLVKRFQDLRNAATQRSRDLEATRQDVVSRIAKAAQPVIDQIYKSKGCGLLLARESVLTGNPSMDISQSVVQGLDAKITNIAFDAKSAAKQPPAMR